MNTVNLTRSDLRVVFRKDKPRFYENETVMLMLLSYPARVTELGHARVISIEQVSLWDKSTHNVPKITNDDAKAGGFKNLGQMRRLFDNSNLEPLYKITVRKI